MQSHLFCGLCILRNKQGLYLTVNPATMRETILLRIVTGFSLQKPADSGVTGHNMTVY